MPSKGKTLDKDTRERLHARFDELLELAQRCKNAESSEEAFAIASIICRHFNFAFHEITYPTHFAISKYFGLEERKGKRDAQKIRKYIAFLVKNTFPLDFFVAEAVEEAFTSLNYGEIHWLMKKENLSLKQPAFTLARLQALAVFHVNVLYGRGLKKSAAQLIVSKAYGIGANDNIHRIRSWESREVTRFFGQKKMRSFYLAAKNLGKMTINRPIEGRTSVHKYYEKLYNDTPQKKRTAPSHDMETYTWTLTVYSVIDDIVGFAERTEPANLSAENRDIITIAHTMSHYPLEVCGELYQQAIRKLNHPQLYFSPGIF